MPCWHHLTDGEQGGQAQRKEEGKTQRRTQETSVHAARKGLYSDAQNLTTGTASSPAAVLG